MRNIGSLMFFAKNIGFFFYTPVIGFMSDTGKKFYRSTPLFSKDYIMDIGAYFPINFNTLNVVEVSGFLFCQLEQCLQLYIMGILVISTQF